MKCPKCKAEMVLRTNRRDNSLFWGCSNYPACTGTIRYVDETDTETDSSFKPSQMQQDVFDFVKYKSGSAVINAVAGSGKTTTIVKAIEYTPKTSTVVFLAFNKAIAEELKKRVPARARVATLHSLGYSFIRQRMPGVQLDQNKMEVILEQHMKDLHVARNLTSLLTRYASLFKSINNLSPAPIDMQNISDYYMLEPLEQNAMDAVTRSLQTSLTLATKQGVIDFDDMILLPALNPNWCDKFDFILADECQDFSALNIQFLLSCTRPDSRVICVGDRNQAIYGFRGATRDAMDILKSELHAVDLPLSICYRCPRVIVAAAQRIVPQIMPRDNAPEGVMRGIKTAEAMEMFQKQDMVICRLNAPLIPWAFRLAKKGFKVCIRGKDIGKSINRIISKYDGKVKTLEDMVVAVRKYRDKEVQRLLDLGKSTAAVNVTDLVMGIEFIAAECETIEEVKQKAETIFSDDASDIVLSSVHKAKGLEADRVFLAKPSAMPMDVQQPWEREQEKNLIYVATTRAKSDFYLLEDDV